MCRLILFSANALTYKDKTSRCKGPARGGNYFPSTFFFTLFQKMIKKFKVIRIKSRADIREKIMMVMKITVTGLSRFII